MDSGTVFWVAYGAVGGFLAGHNLCWGAFKSEIKIAQKISREADALKHRAKFLNEDYICQYSTTYVHRGDEYRLTLEPMWLRLAHELRDRDNPTSEKEGL